MKTYKPNLILSFLVLIVSFLSILVINKQVFAAWYYPQDTPPNTSINNNFVFNPATENFNLGSYSLCLGGVCRNTWPAAGGGGSDANWSINTASSNDLYYTTSSPASGEVGIGTATPNSLLHLYKDSGNNAELDIQSTSGANNHWGIYQDRASKDLRFWQGNNRVTFADSGEVGIGTDPQNNILLNIDTNSRPLSIYSSNTFVGGIGVMGLGLGYGVLGSSPTGHGIYGASSSATTGAGVYGYNGAGGLAAKFDGPIALNGNTAVASGSYLQISSGKLAPAAGACTASDSGRLYLATDVPTLYFCSKGTWLGLIP